MALLEATPSAGAHVTTRETHRADRLCRDERVQRAIIPARVRSMAQSLNLDGIGIVTVSKRRNGDLVLLDGQHRVEALIAAGMGEWEVECHVYHDLSLGAEAALFRTLNNTRRATAYDDFTKGVIAMDDECVAIDDIVEAAGLRVGNQTRHGTVRAVTALRAIYRGKDGAQVLRRTLTVATTAWGTMPDAVDGNVLAGLGAVFARYGDEVDASALTRKLAKRQGGPLALLGDARGLRRLRGVSIAKAVATIVVDTYNKGRRDGALPPL